VAWVLAVILLVAVLVVAAVLGRQITTLQRKLKAAVDGQPSPVVIPPSAEPAAEPASPETPGEPSAAPEPEPPAPAPETVPQAAPAAEPRPDGRLPALWALTLLEQQRQWQLTTGAAPLGVKAPDTLPGALDIEVERIREEVGTPGTLTVDLATATTADDALVFHATRQLLALLVPHTQAFDLVVQRVDDHVVIELTCSGWEGPDQVAEGVGRLLEAVAPRAATWSSTCSPTIGSRPACGCRFTEEGVRAGRRHFGHFAAGDP